MKLRFNTDDSRDIDMTPMIDIIFLLIVFFMIASSFVEQAKVFRADLPAADSKLAETISLEDARIITVTADGTTAGNWRDEHAAGAMDDDTAAKANTATETQFDSMLDVTESLNRYRESMDKVKKEPAVVIAGDKNVKYEKIIHLVNAIKNAGIRNISFQIKPGTPEN